MNYTIGKLRKRAFWWYIFPGGLFQKWFSLPTLFYTKWARFLRKIKWNVRVEFQNANPPSPEDWEKMICKKISENNFSWEKYNAHQGWKYSRPAQDKSYRKCFKKVLESAKLARRASQPFFQKGPGTGKTGPKAQSDWPSQPVFEQRSLLWPTWPDKPVSRF